MGKVIAVYRLKKDLPSLPKGVLFEHREWDSKHPDRGNRGHGTLILAWKNGMCQADWAGDSYVFPGQLARNTEWFEKFEETCSPDIKAEISHALNVLTNLFNKL